MKKIMLTLITFILATSMVLGANSGSIWTTTNSCGIEQQDVNHYSVGEKVFINGANFDEDNYDWDVEGQPGQASCDPNIQVATGNMNVDGSFCFEAYTVQADDCGEYKVHFGNKQDNYRVDELQVPEFSTITAGIALAGSILLFIVLRKKN